MKAITRAAIYIRVSTSGRATNARQVTGDLVFQQNPEVQERPLRQLAEQRGWEVTRVYSDRMSGAREDRPGLKALMQDARRGAFNVVLCWRFDRFARSIEQLVTALAEFRHLGIDFVGARGARHINPYGQGDVHHYRGNGRTRKERHS